MFEIFAYVERMKYIRRWSLMRSLRDETDMEHSFQVAYVAHALAIIGNELYDKTYDVGKVLSLALYHDLPETITGDMPTPVKYCRPEMRAVYKDIERNAGKSLLATLPEELRGAFTEFIAPEGKTAEKALVKVADKISAYLKCLEETKAGNTEFRLAMEGKLHELSAMDNEETKNFMENILPVYSKSLDELQIAVDFA